MVGTYPAVLGNANLHWETSTTADLGVDFGIIKNRIRVRLMYIAPTAKVCYCNGNYLQLQDMDWFGPILEKRPTKA